MPSRARRTRQLTGAHGAHGTPAFMSPEQALGDRTVMDGRTCTRSAASRTGWSRAGRSSREQPDRHDREARGRRTRPAVASQPGAMFRPSSMRSSSSACRRTPTSVPPAPTPWPTACAACRQGEGGPRHMPASGGRRTRRGLRLLLARLQQALGKPSAGLRCDVRPQGLLVSPYLQLIRARRCAQRVDQGRRVVPAALLVEPRRAIVADRAGQPRELCAARVQVRLGIGDQYAPRRCRGPHARCRTDRARAHGACRSLRRSPWSRSRGRHAAPPPAVRESSRRFGGR